MLQLPDIIASAKKRPLSFNPETDQFVYYDDVQSGKAKIYPLDKLSDTDLLKLAVERQLTNDVSGVATLQGDQYSNEKVAAEMRQRTKIGTQLFNADIEYLKFYLSQFPKESFEQLK